MSIKKYKAELLRVQAAKAEMEYLVEQKMEEIKRIEDAMEKQKIAEIGLTQKLLEMEKMTNG